MPRPTKDLIRLCTELGDKDPKDYIPEDRATFAEFREAINFGLIRCAEPDEGGNWRVNIWFKKALLAGFRLGQNLEMDGYVKTAFFDKQTLPTRTLHLASKVRVVPGGTSIRDGAYVGEGVIMMPPAYVNIGAYVGSGTMIDSHALVGSCAQVGERVHLSAAVQIGGVLEPPGSLPVIIEDDVMVGGNSGVYEGAIIKRRAVIGSGVVMNGSTKVYDVVNDQILARDGDTPLIIPEGAVVIPGSRPVKTDWGKEHGLHMATPIIVKYRDENTDAKTALEDALR